MILHRSLKELRRKDKEVIALESREQGFSVYINGANSKSLSLSKQDVCHQQRKAKTAGKYCNTVYVILVKILNNRDVIHLILVM